MKRLTTDTPDGNFETMLNLVFGKDGWAHIRHDGEEGTVPLTQWAKAQCILHGCGEFSAETPGEIDEEISDCLMMDFPDCPIALAYGFAVQACHLRDRLRMYEDVLFDKDGTELLALDDLRELATPNVPLTIKGLKEMPVGAVVWLEYPKNRKDGEWVIIEGIDTDEELGNLNLISIGLLDDFAAFESYGCSWIAYRRKPKEVKP